MKLQEFWPGSKATQREQWPQVEEMVSAESGLEETELAALSLGLSCPEGQAQPS